MAAQFDALTAQEYDRLYAGESGWEFWFGHARRRPGPTQLHGILQILLGYLLKIAGYRASAETELRIAPDWYPRPDVIGIRQKPLEGYPTQVNVVFEILSAGEAAVDKGRLYAHSGIPQVFYFDPELRTIYAWQNEELIRVIDVHLANGAVIEGHLLWAEFEQDCSGNQEA